MIHNNISIIVAIAENFAIGKNNELLFHLPDDLKRFKEITTEHTLIMGRNTLLSLPKWPLPKRRHIVITDKPEDEFPGCEKVFSVEEALEEGEQLMPEMPDTMGMGSSTRESTEGTTVDYTSGKTMVDVIQKIDWERRMRRTSFYEMLYYDGDDLAQMGIGKSYWEDAVSQAYNEVQEAMEADIEVRDRPSEMMPDMPMMPDGGMYFDGPPPR